MTAHKFSCYNYHTKYLILFDNIENKGICTKLNTDLLKDQIEAYSKNRTKNWIIIICFIVATFLLILVSLFIGQAKLSPLETLRAFFNQGPDKNIRMIWLVRMPRIIAAVVVGFGLAISGHIMQVNLQNPLASPTSLGVSSAAVFGANLAIVFGAGTVVGNAGNIVNINNPYVVTVVAFVFAVGTMLAILGISKIRNFSPTTVILLGVAATSLFTALTTLVQYLANDQALSAAVYWSFGDLSRASYLEIIIMSAVIFASFIVFFILRWKYNAMGSGDDIAKTLGVHVSALRISSLLLASLITAVCVSFVGTIGFVGIVCPQLLKRFMGSDSRFLLPASGLLGSILLLISDLIARVIVPGMNLPVAAVTAVIGTPFFVYILLRRKRA